MTKHAKPRKLPDFKTFVASLEHDQDVIGLCNLLDQLFVIDEITNAFANTPYFDFPDARGFFDGEAGRLAKRINRILKGIERLPITGKSDRAALLGALMKYAKHVGDDVEEVASIVERVKQKPITPKQQAA
jgi:hypothetical protein